MNSLNIILLFSFFANVAGQASGVIDMMTNQRLLSPWLSAGSVILDDSTWVSVVSPTGFVATGVGSTVVLMSLPDLGGAAYHQGDATSVRIRNLAYNSATKRVSFDAKLFVPAKDKYCNTSFYTPKTLSGVEMSYLTVEKGAYRLLEKFTFIVGSAQINRSTAVLAANDVNFMYFNFPTGCIYKWNNPALPCSFNNTQLVNQIGAIATIQTLVHDTYMLLRVHKCQRSRVGMILTPHDSLLPEYFSLFGAKETAGYLVFPTGINMTCFEGVQFETAMFESITSNAFPFTYKNTYVTIPSVFGILVSQNSLTDSTSIRVFQRTAFSSKAITQEDKCATNQTIHTSAERASMFIFGVWSGAGPCCFSNLCDPTSAPTFAPSRLPTLAPTAKPTSAPSIRPSYDQCTHAEYDILLMDLFGDGWHNIDILITVDDVTYNYTMDCQNCSGMLHFNSSTCKLNISMVSDGEPITPWEVRWYINHNGEPYVGGWGSELIIRDREVWEHHMIDTDPDSKKNKCHECTHPAPPPGAPGGPGRPGDGKGDSKGKGDGNDGNSTGTGGPGAGGPGAGAGPGGPGGPGGPAPKPPAPKPPAKVRIDIFDEMSNGWFDGDGESTGVCDSELCRNNTAESCPADVIDAADITTYPKYYIMNEKKTKLIHDGTICNPKRGVDICEEVMPYDGTFYFRVAGVEPEGDAATWKFCGREGGIDEELEFFMRHGKCVPGAQTTAKKYCDGLESVTTISATIFLSGMTSADLSAADTRVLETDIATLLPYPERVTLTGWTYVQSDSDSGMEVTFEAVFVVQDGLDHNNVLDVIESARASVDVGMSSGYFVSELKTMLNGLPNSNGDVLRLAKSATLKDITLVDEYFLPAGSSVLAKNPVTEITSPVVEHKTATADSSQFSVSVEVGVAASCMLLAVAAAAVVFTRRDTHTLLPTDSTH